MQIIDLTHKFDNITPVYPGDPVPKLDQIKSISKDGYSAFKIQSCTHTGTHIDAPSHILENGKTLSDFSLDTFIGRGKLIDVRGKSPITEKCLEGITIESTDIIILYTGFSEKFKKPEYFIDYPVITQDFANVLILKKAKMLGMDTPGPDRHPHAIHKKLLENDVLLLENMTNLKKLLSISEFRITALPLNLSADGAPARVIAEIQ
ncbi:MAG: cyclase family protein [Candidatus Theseobacter exili]|nr:cyclase family protein [Candidatus Theseobacter exili]